MDRETRIDLVRGFSLLAIFVGHSGTVFSEAFQQSRGFSDASELFVIMAGMSCGIAYLSRGPSASFRATFARALRRAATLYAVHVAMVLVLAGVVLLPMVQGQPDVLAVLGMSHFWKEPLVHFIEVGLLEFMPADLDILPLYVVLMPLVPVILVLRARSVPLLLATSALIWAAAGVEHLNFVNLALTNGRWYFDPLSWQLVFAIGIVLGARIRTGQDPLPYHRVVFGAAVAIVILAVPANLLLHFHFTDISATGAYHALTSKTHLGVLRLTNAMAIVYVVWNLGFIRRIDPGGALRSVYAAGRNSLPIFVVGVSLSTAIASLMASDLPVSVGAQILMVVAGCLLQLSLALRLEGQPAFGFGARMQAFREPGSLPTAASVASGGGLRPAMPQPKTLDRSGTVSGSGSGSALLTT